MKTQIEILKSGVAKWNKFCLETNDTIDLRWAYLSGADLSGADLRWAYLRGADLSGADLRGAYLPAPTIVLLASWGIVSPGLCRDLMRFDAANCPSGRKRFAAWKGGTQLYGGECPYSGVKVQRAAQFKEQEEHYSPGPAKSALNLMIAVIREKCADSDYHEVAK